MIDLTERVRRAADGLPVVAVWLFGSTARGERRADSDTDLAVLLARGVPVDGRLDVRLRLLTRLQQEGVE